MSEYWHSSSLPAATVPMSGQIDFRSGLNGRDYCVQIAFPAGAPPEGGYPVLYVVDGDMHFPAFVSTARIRSHTLELEPAVVVGIGYPESRSDLLACLQRRNADLTPTQASSEEQAGISRQLGGLAVDRFGEADIFLDIIETEIKPRVSELVPVAAGRDILFGHSLGGMFTLHALFTRPAMFSTFLALSPSIWWDGQAVLKGEAGFVHRVRTGEAAPRVFVGVGEHEQDPSYIPQMPAEAVLQAAMVDNAQSLAERLAAVEGAAGYRVESRLFAGETHTAVATTAINALLDFALPGPTPRARAALAA
ncbi:alpha/beta hydrolase [Sphingopyxis macrogoltabida]|uniref:Esterase n=1 Tax=Sphingopyxis macrogoltabida TaxID=33050 RepID=A0AAC9FH04_SPHMC|nr:alpha/beta hydrolase-fold protein [Sphingopyxis macrogoltabida]ALJ15888.1 putative esterase [Sphingopyxis macrogoltabida]AMU92128.1 hypothetical protein ATM17_24235 [Sphingopyxis macrogoltabida]